MSGLNYYGFADIGEARRENGLNEDAFLGFIHPTKNVLFIAVADGLGGRKEAWLAPHAALDEFRAYVEKNLENDKPDHIKTVMQTALFWANRTILAVRQTGSPLYEAQGTTLTAAAITLHKDFVFAHVGNSRIYLLRQGNLMQMTKDHTEAQSLVDQRKITPEESRVHPGRATLTKGLGAAANLEPDLFGGGKVSTGDIVLLATDGLYQMLTDAEMTQIILEAGESKKACESLIETANTRGGYDNMAIVLSHIGF